MSERLRQNEIPNNSSEWDLLDPGTEDQEDVYRLTEEEIIQDTVGVRPERMREAEAASQPEAIYGEDSERRSDPYKVAKEDIIQDEVTVRPESGESSTPYETDIPTQESVETAEQLNASGVNPYEAQGQELTADTEPETATTPEEEPQPESDDQKLDVESANKVDETDETQPESDNDSFEVFDSAEATGQSSTSPEQDPGVQEEAGETENDVAEAAKAAQRLSGNMRYLEQFLQQRNVSDPHELLANIETRVAELPADERQAYVNQIKSVFAEENMQSLWRPGGGIGQELPNPKGSMVQQISHETYQRFFDTVIQPLMEEDETSGQANKESGDE
jgi:hypothetical protein